MVRDLGHARWKQENNGGNDLTQNWSLKHGFLHACRHRPHAAAAQHQSPQPLPNAATAATSSTIPESTRNPECQNDLIGWPPPPEMVELIPNLGLAAVVLILMRAFTLCAFTQCHSKLVRRYHLTGVEGARQLRMSVSKLPPRIRAPDSPARQLQTI